MTHNSHQWGVKHIRCLEKGMSFNSMRLFKDNCNICCTCASSTFKQIVCLIAAYLCGHSICPCLCLKNQQGSRNSVVKTSYGFFFISWFTFTTSWKIKDNVILINYAWAIRLNILYTSNRLSLNVILHGSVLALVSFLNNETIPTI